MSGLIFIKAFFFASILVFSAGITSAQFDNFNQTGKIRPVVSETTPNTTSFGKAPLEPGFNFTGDARSKVDFYFTYFADQNGAQIEKWVLLSEDKKWNALSNQTVRISGKLNNNKLSDASILPLTQLTEDYLLNPPATTGLYKVVVVPLTIQPQSAQETFQPTGVTPEDIRGKLFNSPDAVNKFYQEASYGKFGLTGVHHPQGDIVPVAIQATISNNCQEQIINEFTSTVRQRLREHNIDTTRGDADLGIIIFNDTPGCPPYPFATRGALGTRGAPLWLWMPESWFATGPAIIAHEIGHALGGNHPAAMRCADFNDLQTCVSGEADDRDLMTYGGKYYLMPNNYERRRWGWHPPEAFIKPSSGFLQMFDLHSPVLPAFKDGMRQGRFHFRNLNGAWMGWDIYPETRLNWGQFERYNAADEPFRLGIAVRIGHSNFGDPDALSILIDSNQTSGYEDAPLRENEQVSIGGITVKCVVEHNPQRGARMKIFD